MVKYHGTTLKVVRFFTWSLLCGFYLLGFYDTAVAGAYCGIAPATGAAAG